MRSDDFERLYEEHAPGLLGFLVHRTGDRPLAEDILADTFERVLRTRVRFDPRRGSEKTWIYTIALNRLRDHARRGEVERRALERTAVGLGPAAGGLEAAEERGDLARALERLDPDEREAVALRYGADLTMREVARVAGERLTTVEGRVYRALRKLRDVLED